METWGNSDILKLEKIAFLCSQKCPADVVLKSYDWAKAQREAGHCIVCGNHSQIEKDVFDILFKGRQPLILVLARKMKSRWEPEIEKAVATFPQPPFATHQLTSSHWYTTPDLRTFATALAARQRQGQCRSL
jgi:hypothetical protein